jgi:endonuclease/exonuclease/phosphatase family metal-dependent hydrolase
MNIKVATYNILHGTYPDLIIKNIEFLVCKGADVICLQEAEPEIYDRINNLTKMHGLEVISYHHSIGCSLITIYNPTVLTLQSSEHFLLPALSHPSWQQKLTNFASEIIQRGVLFTSFVHDGKVVRVINTHLAWEGGPKHRISQLEFIKEYLNKQSTDCDILVGDFNTFTLTPTRTEEIKIENTLPDWTNVSKDISWTCDTQYTSPRDGLTKYAKIGKLFGVKFSCKLDHIFTKNIKIVSKEMFDLPGSDHRPLLAELEIL